MQVELALARSRVDDVADLRVSARLTNDSADPVALNMDFLSMPALVLQVKDESDAPVPLGPPPVPPLEISREDLPAGESVRFSYHGIFGSPPPAGTYYIRFYFRDEAPVGVLRSSWTRFTVLG